MNYAIGGGGGHLYFQIISHMYDGADDVDEDIMKTEENFE